MGNARSGKIAEIELYGMDASEPDIVLANLTRSLGAALDTDASVIVLECERKRDGTRWEVRLLVDAEVAAVFGGTNSTQPGP